MLIRPRRRRTTQAVRDLVRETRLNIEQMVYPLFLLDGKNKNIAILQINLSTISVQNTIPLHIYFTLSLYNKIAP